MRKSRKAKNRLKNMVKHTQIDITREERGIQREIREYHRVKINKSPNKKKRFKEILRRALHLKRKQKITNRKRKQAEELKNYI